MTQYPEVTSPANWRSALLNVSLVTDWGCRAGRLAGVRTVTADEVTRVFSLNNERIKDFLFKMIPAIPRERSALQGCPQERGFLTEIED